jgi:hypothetical protein
MEAKALTTFELEELRLVQQRLVLIVPSARMICIMKNANANPHSYQLPSIDLEARLEIRLAKGASKLLKCADLIEIRRDDRTIRELPSCQCLKCFLRGFRGIVFDVNLSHTGRLSAAARRSGDLHLENFAILLAFLLDIFADFYTPNISWDHECIRCDDDLP